MGTRKARVAARSEGDEGMTRHARRPWRNGIEAAIFVLSLGVIAMGILVIGFGSFLIGYGWGMR